MYGNYDLWIFDPGVQDNFSPPYKQFGSPTRDNSGQTEHAQSLLRCKTKMAAKLKTKKSTEIKGGPGTQDI